MKIKIGFTLLFVLILILGVLSFLNAPIKGKIVKAGTFIEGPAFIRPDINSDRIVALAVDDKYLVEKKSVLFYSSFLYDEEIKNKMEEEGWEVELY